MLLMYDVAFSANTDALRDQIAQLKKEVDDAMSGKNTGGV